MIPMPETPVICCPICTAPMAYADRISQHLRKEHGKKQMSYALLESASTNFLIVNKWGRVYQKTGNTEHCWMAPGSVDRFSTWQLLHGEQPLFCVVGETYV